MDILIGTKNQYKATEIARFLGKLPGVKIHSWDEFGLEIKVEEDQKNLKANAEKKAIEISKQTDWYVLASDGGVDIHGLGKKWDILRNQRIVGENKTDLEKADKLLHLMKGLKGEKRKASYHLQTKGILWKNLLTGRFRNIGGWVIFGSIPNTKMFLTNLMKKKKRG